MVKKYAFKRGQTVAFTPEEGVIVTGKIIAFHVFTNGFKKGGEPRPKRAAYTVEEPVFRCRKIIEKLERGEN